MQRRWRSHSHGTMHTEGCAWNLTRKAFTGKKSTFVLADYGGQDVSAKVWVIFLLTPSISALSGPENKKHLLQDVSIIWSQLAKIMDGWSLSKRQKVEVTAQRLLWAWPLSLIPGSASTAWRLLHIPLGFSCHPLGF